MKVSAKINPPLSDLRVALVHDDFIQDGGAEKLFLAIAELFPAADIFTSMATDSWLSRLAKRKIRTSFMQSLPFKEKLYRYYFPLYPLAFESFDLSAYDLVISYTTRFAFGVITKPGTTHICYANSPGRMFWEGEQYFGPNSRLQTILAPVLSYLRLWSFTAAQRVDHFIANSKNIATKVDRYLGRKASVVYPFVDLKKFRVRSSDFVERSMNHEPKTQDYFLVVSRLARWKRIDLAIEAAKQLGLRLKVVGTGPEKKKLEHAAGGDSSIQFLGSVPPAELAELYKNCQALIMTQEEDFGITALEAQASGRPVVAYKAGGALETVIAGKTGEFFEHQNAESLAGVLKQFRSDRYDSRECRENAARFSKEKFQSEFIRKVAALLE